MKRAREQNGDEAAIQEGETASAHHDHTTTASPNRKKARRGGLVDDEEEGGLSEWNLLRDLPYVAFRRLLDFLSSSTTNAGGSSQVVLPGVPELCRVRAESGRFVGALTWGVDLPPGEEVDFALKMEAQEKRLRSLRPYRPPRRRRAQHHHSISSVAALRLTCHAIKNAVDHALGAAAQGSALYAPLDQFLANHFFPPSTAGSDEAPPLPLLSDSAEAARTKEQFRKMADLTLGVTQARLHQLRLDEVLEYVWRTWEFAPAKLEALRRQLLAPRATVGAAAPLLKVEYLRREDDYLGRSYGLGIRACLSLGLPDLPHERAEVGLWVLQAWDHRDNGWDLQVFVDLRTSSTSWKQLLKSSRQGQQNEEEEEEEEEEEGDEEEGEDDGASAPLHVAVFDYYRSRGYVTGQTTADFTLLRKLWRCVGLPASGDGGGDDAGSDQSQSWKGTEVLTTLLACLGFAWHDDVNLLWDDCGGDDADTVNKYVAGIGQGHGHGRGGRLREVQNTLLLKTSRAKHKELLQDLAPYVTQLNAFLDARQQSASTEVKTREQVVRRVRRFIDQQRVARTESYIRQRIQGCAPWPSASECPEFALAKIDGCEVAKQLRVVYARTLDLAPGEYSDFSDRTVELAFPVSADALRRVELAGEDDGGDDDHHRAGPLPLEVVVRVSTKSANCYTGKQEQSMVTARVVGHHARLTGALAAKAVAAANMASGLGRRSTPMQPNDTTDEEEGQEATKEEEEDTVVLKLDRAISDMGRHEKVMATEAIELVGRLLGLTLRPTTSNAPQAADTDADADGTGGPRPSEKSECTPFAHAVLAFLDEAARMATWDAEEGTFPVQSALRQDWDEEEACGDDDDDEEDTNITAEQHESQLTREIGVLCDEWTERW